MKKFKDRAFVVGFVIAVGLAILPGVLYKSAREFRKRKARKMKAARMKYYE